MTQIGEMAHPGVTAQPAWLADVTRAASHFAAALSETPELAAFQEAHAPFDADIEAQEALHAYRARQRYLQPLAALGVATPEQRVELEQLWEAWRAKPSAARLLETEDVLCRLFRSLDELLPGRIGLGFAATCRPRCCG